MSAAKEKPPVAATTGGQPKSVVANGVRRIAHSTAPSKRIDFFLSYEGVYLHARYRLATPDCLIIQAANRQVAA